MNRRGFVGAVAYAFVWPVLFHHRSGHTRGPTPSPSPSPTPSPSPVGAFQVAGFQGDAFQIG